MFKILCVFGKWIMSVVRLFLDCLGYVGWEGEEDVRIRMVHS